MITKPLLEAFRKDFATAVAELEKQYNIKLELGSIGFDKKSFGGRLTAVLQNEEATEELKKEFELTAKLFGIKCMYKQKINIKGEIYSVDAINSRRSKYPIELSSADGKSIKCSINYINRLVEDQKLETLPQDKYFFGEEKPEKATISVNGGKESEIDVKSVKVYTVPENASREEQIKMVLEQGCERKASVIAKVLGMNSAYVSRILKNIA